MKKVMEIISALLTYSNIYSIICGVVASYLLSRSLFYNSLKKQHLKAGLDVSNMSSFMKFIANFFSVFDKNKKRIVICDLNAPERDRLEKCFIYDPFWAFAWIVLGALFAIHSILNT